MLARIKLKRRLRALDPQMQARSRVREGDEGAQGQGAGVEGDGGGGGGGDDHAVVEGGGGCGEGEGGVGGRGRGGVGGDGAGRDAVGVEDEVLVCVEGGDCAVDGWGGGVEVEVAGLGGGGLAVCGLEVREGRGGAYLWFVTPTTVSLHSSPMNVTWYSTSSTVFPSSILPMYQTLHSTVPGYPSSICLLT